MIREILRIVAALWIFVLSAALALFVVGIPFARSRARYWNRVAEIQAEELRKIRTGK